MVGEVSKVRYHDYHYALEALRNKGKVVVLSCLIEGRRSWGTRDRDKQQWPKTPPWLFDSDLSIANKWLLPPDGLMSDGC